MGHDVACVLAESPLEGISLLSLDQNERAIVTVCLMIVMAFACRSLLFAAAWAVRQVACRVPKARTAWSAASPGLVRVAVAVVPLAVGWHFALGGSGSTAVRFAAGIVVLAMLRPTYLATSAVVRRAREGWCSRNAVTSIDNRQDGL